MRRREQRQLVRRQRPAGVGGDRDRKPRAAPLVAISPIRALTTGTSFGPAKVIAPGTAPIGIAPTASTSAS